MNKQKRISTLIIILIVVGVVVVVGGGLLTYQYFVKPQAEPTACTQEAKLCPDGSYVSRTGPNCEFAECPANQSNLITNPGPEQEIHTLAQDIKGIYLAVEQKGVGVTGGKYAALYYKNLEDNSISTIFSPPGSFSDVAISNDLNIAVYQDPKGIEVYNRNNKNTQTYSISSLPETTGFIMNFSISADNTKVSFNAFCGLGESSNCPSSGAYTLYLITGYITAPTQ